jgi:hypothetical protein
MNFILHRAGNPFCRVPARASVGRCVSSSPRPFLLRVLRACTGPAVGTRWTSVMLQGGEG